MIKKLKQLIKKIKDSWKPTKGWQDKKGEERFKVKGAGIRAGGAPLCSKCFTLHFHNEPCRKGEG